jgi:hypothetical protein
LIVVPTGELTALLECFNELAEATTTVKLFVPSYDGNFNFAPVSCHFLSIAFPLFLN